MVNICVIGNKNVGKTAWKQKWGNGSKKFKYNKTVFKFTKLDKADCVFIMFDVTDQQSYDDIILWYNLVRKMGNIPICLIGNKIDAKSRKVKAAKINFHNTHNLTYFEMSCKSGYNFEKPLEWAINGFKLVDDYEVIAF